MISSAGLLRRGVDGMVDVRAAFFGDWEGDGGDGEDGLTYMDSH